MLSFASDNNSGVHPKVLLAIQEAARLESAPAYGADQVNQKAQEELSKRFGPGTEAFFVFNGSAANVTALASFVKPYEAVVTAETSHLQNDECGAFERLTGAKIFLLPPTDGKITPDQVAALLKGTRGNVHASQPRAISITQTTECGTIYTLSEIQALADFAHAHEMILHVDGARISNALAALNATPRQLAATGLDVLSFGGTKNGLLLGEAVVFFHRPEAKNFPFVRKQSLQLASKMRFIAAQFEAYLQNDLYLENARHANTMAQRLYEGIREIPGVKIEFPVQANALFVKLSPDTMSKLQKEFYFYLWDSESSVARLMCSFETTPQQVDTLIEAVRRWA